MGLKDAFDRLNKNPHEPVVIGAGVMIKREYVGTAPQDIAIVFGGQRARVDTEAVLNSTRAILADWPNRIMQVNILVEDPPKPRKKFRDLVAKRKRK